MAKTFSSGGNDKEFAEMISKQPSRVVATGLSRHRVAANVNPFGAITVYYFENAGYVSAKTSYDGGVTWQVAKNW
jgi:YD repeat-containing protein